MNNVIHPSHTFHFGELNMSLSKFLYEGYREEFASYLKTFDDEACLEEHEDFQIFLERIFKNDDNISDFLSFISSKINSWSEGDVKRFIVPVVFIYIQSFFIKTEIPNIFKNRIFDILVDMKSSYDYGEFSNYELLERAISSKIPLISHKGEIRVGVSKNSETFTVLNHKGEYSKVEENGEEIDYISAGSLKFISVSTRRECVSKIKLLDTLLKYHRERGKLKISKKQESDYVTLWADFCDIYEYNEDTSPGNHVMELFGKYIAEKRSNLIEWLQTKQGKYVEDATGITNIMSKHNGELPALQLVKK